MKKNRSANRQANSSRLRVRKAAGPIDDLLPEYRFEYRKARPNRFATRFKAGSRLVLLDPDVAQVFTSPESVNAVLRALLLTMPSQSAH
jgi:hypothetical protein